MIPSQTSLTQTSLPSAIQFGKSEDAGQKQTVSLSLESGRDTVDIAKPPAVSSRKRAGLLTAMMATLPLLGGVAAPATEANAQTLRPAVATTADIGKPTLTPVHHEYYPPYGPTPGQVIDGILDLLDALEGAGRYDYPYERCVGPRWNRHCQYIPDPSYHYDRFSLGVTETRRGPVYLYRNGEVISARGGYLGHLTTDGNAYINRTFIGYAQQERELINGRYQTVSMIRDRHDNKVGFVGQSGNVYKINPDDTFYRIGYLDLTRPMNARIVGTYALLAYPELQR